MPSWWFSAVRRRLLHKLHMLLVNSSCRLPRLSDPDPVSQWILLPTIPFHTFDEYVRRSETNLEVCVNVLFNIKFWSGRKTVRSYIRPTVEIPTVRRRTAAFSVQEAGDIMLSTSQRHGCMTYYRSVGNARALALKAKVMRVHERRMISQISAGV